MIPIEAFKIYKDFRHDKDYKDFIEPYRGDFRKIIDTMFLHPSQLTQLFKDMDQEKGRILLRRYLDILVKLGTLRFQSSIEWMINNSHFYPKVKEGDKKLILEELDKGIYDAFLIYS